MLRIDRKALPAFLPGGERMRPEQSQKATNEAYGVMSEQSGDGPLRRLVSSRLFFGLWQNAHEREGHHPEE
ncbi:hypothetical protein [Beijerinckia mobilis]|uniref:hypothetical protein n=1 Tax=Beijerinckia mobilis TaxID=231434 RepID=UPI00054DBBCA|nr:hypothetical protein [Beijerinckia mobilis]